MLVEYECNECVYVDYVHVLVGVSLLGIAWSRLGVARHDMDHENTLGNDQDL